MASNLPMSVANSIVLGNPSLPVIAGKTTSFVLEIRTTNANLRANTWFASMTDSIKLSFSTESVAYQIA